jgi:hypothetical protein
MLRRTRVIPHARLASRRNPKAKPLLARTIWATLNSGFVLWLLSSVAVVLISNLWSDRQRAQTAIQNAKLRETRLRSEVAERIMASVADADPAAVTRGELLLALKRHGVFEPNGQIGGLPEFEGRSLASLMLEWREIRPDLKDRLDQARSDLVVLRMTLGVPRSPRFAELDASDAEKALQHACIRILDDMVNRLEPLVEVKLVDNPHVELSATAAHRIVSDEVKKVQQQRLVRRAPE